MQGVIKHPIEGSTNVYLKPFKAIHRRLYDALKGIGDDDCSQQCMMTEGADELLKVQSQRSDLEGSNPR